jgi:DNA-binding MarR family transcriptional regulator
MNTKKAELINEFLEVSEKIGRISHKYHKISPEKKFATILQYQALSCIEKESGITVGELAENCIMTSGAIAQLLERLTQFKWIQKEVDKNDRRITHLYLTKGGELQLKKIKKMRQLKMTEIISLVSEDDIKYLINILKKLSIGLEQKTHDKIS